jgi:putative ABC transport system ATP-binding protein
MKSLVSVRDVHKTFHLGDHVVQALKGVNLEIFAGDFLAIAGTSGSGKTSLLNLIGCIDNPSQGLIVFDDKEIHQISDNELAKIRAEKIGFIFQTFNLLPVLTAFENVEYALQLLGVSTKERKIRTEEALRKVQLEKFMNHRPAQLSGGQRQRVAIARALVKEPQLILADEPTANLDSATAADVLDLMLELNSKEKTTFVFSTHDPAVLNRARKCVHIYNGQIVDENQEVVRVA